MRLAAVQKRREVENCFNVRKAARCFCRRQKCAYERGMAIHLFFAAEKPLDGAGARSACFPPSSSKASAPVPVCFAAGILLFAELQNERFFPLRLHGVGGQSRKFVLTGFYLRRAPDLSITQQSRGGRFAFSSKASAPVPVCFSAWFLLIAELQNERFFPSAIKIFRKRQKVGQKCGQIAATGRKIIEKKIII